jgi:mannose-6-phosphate isomerase-like protein (cupin superfamily)
MNPFTGNLEELTINNNAYRHVLFTDPGKLQLVVMKLKPNEEIGREIHDTTTQFIRIEQGDAIAMIGTVSDPMNDKQINLSKHGQDTIIIPQGTYHNIINKSNTDLHLYSIYSPPEHPPETYQEHKINNMNAGTGSGIGPRTKNEIRVRENSLHKKLYDEYKGLHKMMKTIN